jgi:hypothetical protein
MNVLDLFVEFRNRTNGLALPHGAGLLGALAYFGCDGIGAVEKNEMRALALRGGPYTDAERRDLLNYCQSDVDALAKLLPYLEPAIDLPRALLRGRYMRAVARMEHVGVPIDLPVLTTLRERWTSIQNTLIERVDADFHVFEGQSFRTDRWAAYLAANGIGWPRLSSGRLDLGDDTFREMARSHPQVAPMRELRHSLSKLRLEDLSVGRSRRNRCLLGAFGNQRTGEGKTGRNAPSNSKFVFGPGVWIRGLIRPEPGYGIAYIDWSAQEYGIAAALSGDPAMVAAYQTGDPHLALAIWAGAAPPGATKKTHSAVRDIFKTIVLGVLYGMAHQSLAERLNVSPARARELLDYHHRAYPQFWRWSDAAVDHAMLVGTLHTVFGWVNHVGTDANPRSLRNFPMQSNGAEMLRLACCYMTEAGIRVCAPVHDAVLIEAPLEELEQVVANARRLMAKASAMVLDGFELRTDAKLIRYPNRYMDERGTKMWAEVMDLLGRPDIQSDGGQKTCPPTATNLGTGGHPSLLLSL